MKDNTLTYISLFSSAGVGCYGFKMEGFQCIATNELIKRRLDIQRYNGKCKYVTGYICGDITINETKDRLFQEINFWKRHENLKEVDVVIATPPCQGMSVANHKKAEDEIIRNSLVVESIKMINRIRPRFFIFENVAAFMKTACTDIDGKIKSIGEAIQNNLGEDYSIFSDVINFKNYGACSSRTRTIVIAVRKDLADYVAPIELFPDFVEEKTLRQTIGNLKPLKEFGEIDQADIYHAFRTYPENMRSWVSELKEGESAFDNTDPSRIPHRVVKGKIVYNQRKNGDKYRRQIWDKVGPCIHTRNDQFASQNTIHPADDRVFSIRELMKMMTVPDDFKWVETPFDQLNSYTIYQKKSFLKKEEIKIRQSLGEAVPTQIFYSIAQKINFFLTKRNIKTSEINQEIEKFNLSDTPKLKRYIDENHLDLGLSSLCKITELANAKRTKNAAYFTNKSIVNEIVKTTPIFEAKEIRILEPSVGVGNFIPLIMKKYQSIPKLIIDVVDIDADVLDILRLLLKKISIPRNVQINYIHDDFLLHQFEMKYDLVIGNPPFSKMQLSERLLKKYKLQVYNNQTTNTFAFFLEKAIKLGKYVAMITPKFVLNTPEFKLTRDLLERLKIDHIIDFGEHGFEDVLVETVCVCIVPDAKPTMTSVTSIPFAINLNQKQSYICDNTFPYWIIYRNSNFDRVCSKMEFGIFDVFRDRQITKRLLNDKYGLRVVKSRNISDDGTTIVNIQGYDSYIKPEKAQKLSVYKFLDRDDVYLTPNMSYKPRVMKKPKGVLVNGSAAILIPKNSIQLTEKEMKYFSTLEYRDFYRVARNYQTRSLNVDANSVYFFGRVIKSEDENEVVI